jgi:Glycosyl hydrolase family 12
MIKKILAAGAMVLAGLGIANAANASVVHNTRYIGPGNTRFTQGKNYYVRSDDFGASTWLKSDGEHSFTDYGGQSWSNWDAFPYIGRGCSWGICAPYNYQAPQVDKAGNSNPYVSLWTTQTYRGNYNTALDMWFSTYAQRDGASNGAEIMIWTDHPGINPGIDWYTWIDGQEWGVMHWRTSTDGVGRNYIAYIAVKQSGEFYGDLNPFFWKTESYGLLNANWYWTSIDAGFELTGNGSGKGLGVDYFSVKG